ncbi:MAG TPA: hypothetical protein VF066_01975 [Thermoleophilaceae bacterium]
MRRALLAVLVTALACVPARAAGWSSFQEGDLGSTAYLGLHRTPDGVLHAVWERADRATNSTDIFHRTVSSAGAFGPLVTVANWPATSPPDIAANPGGGLIALWGGLKPGNVESGSATAGDDGAAWTEGAEPIDRGRQVYASPLSIESGADGTVFEAFFGTFGTWVHRGTDGSAPSSNYQQQLGGLAFSAPNLARDGADGSLWLGWPVFNAGQNNGAWVQQVDQATGAPSGAPIKVPGSSVEQNGATNSFGTLGRWAITGRPGRPGIFVAAPVDNDIVFWRVGQTGSITLDSGSGRHRQVAIAADPDGRVIVFWGTDTGTGTKLFARVSDTGVNSFGPAFEIPPPPGTSSTLVWGLAASAQSGALYDLFADVTIGGEAHYWHTQGLPPPVLAKSVNTQIVKPPVLVKLPGSSAFAPLAHDSQVPVGATVDARKGRVRIVTALPNGKTQSADFFEGVFSVSQAKTGLATMVLAGGSFGSCGKTRGASAAKVKEIRRLWAAGSGKFRTKGRYAAATIRGTTWLTSDRCNGTLIRVTQGAVTVRRAKARGVVVLTRGKSVLIPARR